MKTIKVNKNTLNWLTSNNTGLSSINLIRFYFGFGLIHNNFAPLDDSDRARCLYFLKTISIADAKLLLKKISKVSTEWEKQADILVKNLTEL